MEDRPRRQGSQPPYEQLTNREFEILRLLAATSDTNKSIAKLVILSDRTVEFHLRSIYHKLGVKNRLQAVQRAKALGLLSNGDFPPQDNDPHADQPQPHTA